MKKFVLFVLSFAVWFGSCSVSSVKAAETCESEVCAEAFPPPAENALVSTASIADMKPGEIIDRETVLANKDNFFLFFEIQEGDDVYNRIIWKSYYPNDVIHLDDLYYLKMAHYNFNHEIQVGEMIVNRKVLDNVFSVFKELFDMEYEIQSMYLVDNYWTGDADSSDSASIDVNNTSAFCFRTATGSGNLSNHAYGAAIDINPQQNPYVKCYGGEVSTYHANAYQYLDRSCGDPHVIVHGDDCYNVFIRNGFGWGGDWTNGILDYQHFDMTVY